MLVAPIPWPRVVARVQDFVLVVALCNGRFDGFGMRGVVPSLTYNRS